MSALLAKPRLRALIDALGSGLLEREAAVRLALLAALAGEHLLLIGPPGSAKSELARRLHRVFAGGAYFERLLTRFTVPEELFGPLSISALEQDRFERKTEGYLPSASIAFIDEVFKANSAILNALLTLLNEREFDNGAQRVRTPLITVIGASNEVPGEDLLAAFYDRFLLRCQVANVSDDAFASLLRLPELGTTEIPSGLQVSAAELAALAQRREAVALPDDVVAALVDLRGFLVEKGIVVSDRRWRRIVGVLRTAALTDGREAVSRWDLWLTQFCACEQPGQAALVLEWFGRRLGTWQALDPQRLEHAVKAFEATLEQEQTAQELNFDDSGKLQLARQFGAAETSGASMRMTSLMNRRRWGEAHIGARVAQVDELLGLMDGYLVALAAQIEGFDAEVAGHLWIDPRYVPIGRRALLGTQSAIRALRERAAQARAGFLELPRLEGNAGTVPSPVDSGLPHELQRGLPHEPPHDPLAGAPGAA